MRLYIKNALIYNTSEKSFFRGNMICAGGRIIWIGSAERECEKGDRVIDADGGYVVPGFIDIHTHGRMGYDFCNAGGRELEIMKKSYLDCGVTTVVPTFASAELKDWMNAIDRIEYHRSPCRDGAGARLWGLHLEGRYLSHEKRGVQAESLLVDPSTDELGKILMKSGLPLHVTYAPELDGKGNFADYALSHNITLSAGHTAMTYDEAKLAEKRGVHAYTHLFNAMPKMHHREGGAVCAALEGDAYCELICDGHHISPGVIRLVWKCKGSDRLVLISDSMEGAGAPDGEYQIAGVPVFMKDGVALSADGTLGGSTLDMFGAVRNVMKFCDLPLEQVLPCATLNPAKVMGMESDYGTLEKGKMADALILRESDGELKIDKKIVAGTLVD